MSIFSVSAVGAAALEIILHTQQAAVMGLTSRGVFCSTKNGKSIFISYENWRGPLTINLNLGVESEGGSRYLRKEQRITPPPFNQIIHGSAVRILPDQIRFEDVDISILFKGIFAWKAAVRPIVAARMADARIRLARVAKKVMDEGSGKGWIQHIPRWAGLEIQLKTENDGIETDLQRLAKVYLEGNAADILGLMDRFLGKGSGLTPSGDDFVIGLLLGLNAISEISPVSTLTGVIGGQLIRQAQVKTTSLSANLIQCALDGQADERLISALDGILWGNLPVEECARRLIDYGSSSGGDTLLGMALALSLH